MAEAYSVEIKIVEIQKRGICNGGHKVGDTWTVTGTETVSGLCGWAFQAIMPFMTVLRFGGGFPWEDDKDKAVVCCPDPHNPVVFELKRLR